MPTWSTCDGPLDAFVAQRAARPARACISAGAAGQGGDVARGQVDCRGHDGLLQMRHRSGPRNRQDGEPSQAALTGLDSIPTQFGIPTPLRMPVGRTAVPTGSARCRFRLAGVNAGRYLQDPRRPLTPADVPAQRLAAASASHAELRVEPHAAASGSRASSDRPGRSSPLARSCRWTPRPGWAVPVRSSVPRGHRTVRR